MPEGDTIHYAAKRVGAALTGREIRSIETPHPRTRGERWTQKLDGRGVRSVDAHGKHLFIRFEGDLTLHSHLRMTGKWGVYRHGERWRRARRRAWLVIRTEQHEVVQFDGPVLELTTDSRTRFDPHLAGLGPDVLAPEFDQRKFLARIREDDQTRGLGRRAAGPAQPGRHRQHLEGGVVLHGRPGPVEADGRRWPTTSCSSWSRTSAR